MHAILLKRLAYQIAGDRVLLELARYHSAPDGKRRTAASLRLRVNIAAYALLESLVGDEEKAGFRVDQPRWPAGSGKLSGRWSGGAGSAPPLASSASGSRNRGGHHYVSRSIFKDPKLGLSNEARQVFNRGVTGKLRATKHGWDAAHSKYSKAVRAELIGFIAKRRIDPGIMTTAQATEFLDKIKASDNWTIRSFNKTILMREAIYWIRRGPRGRGSE